MTHWTEAAEGFLLPERFLQLSAFLARKFHPPLTIFTDPGRGLETLQRLKIQADEVNTTLLPEKLSGIPSHFWTACKLAVYEEMALRGSPFFHIDSDAFLLRPLPERVQTAQIFSQSAEKFFRNNNAFGAAKYYELDKVIETLPFIPPDMHDLMRRPIQFAACFGVFGGTNTLAIKEYSQEMLWLFYRHPDNCRALKTVAFRSGVFAEQWGVGLMMRRRNIGMTYLFPDFQSPWASWDNAKENHYAHACGNLKQDLGFNLWVDEMIETFNVPI